MELRIARIILFAKDMAERTSFYGGVLGLSRVDGPEDSPKFVSFQAGAVQFSLHAIPERYTRTIEISDPPIPLEGAPIKVAFGVEDVAGMRRELNSRGARMGPAREFGDLHLCDGTDPEGNVFQLSNRC
jgi:catechol 2,3-dioxygenase-like lactoylglutathione lyase family enzyme